MEGKYRDKYTYSPIVSEAQYTERKYWNEMQM
jgi:hypothetical protein